MKKLFLISLILPATLMVEAACSGSSGICTSERDAATPVPDAASLNINIIVGGQIITATMEDNGAASDFLSRLPLEVTLEDYSSGTEKISSGTEKIFYPDPDLNLDDTPRGCEPQAGDITIYEPWGNVAIFCRDWPESNSLIKIGHIDGDGIKLLQGTESMNVRFERQ